MKKAELIRALTEVQRTWDQLLEGISPERLTEPATLGEWSIQDVIVHMAWVEAQTAAMLRAQAPADASELWRQPEDERDAAVVQAQRGRPLADTLREAQQTQRELVEVLEGIHADDIDGADWFANLPGKWPPSRVVEVYVINHYQEHIEELARWYRRSL